MRLFLGVVLFISCCAVADEYCPICKRVLHRSDVNQELCCSHSFHTICIARWNNEHDNCPVCRGKIVLHTSRNREVEHDRCSHNPDQRILAEFINFASAEELRLLLDTLESISLEQWVVYRLWVTFEHSITLTTSLSREQNTLIARLREKFDQLLSGYDPEQNTGSNNGTN